MADWAELIWKGFLMIGYLFLLNGVIGLVLGIPILFIGWLFGWGMPW